MELHRGALFRLYPTPAQSELMAQFAGACRFVYNLALEQRRDWYRPGRRINFATQCREVTQLRAEVDWLRAAPADCLHQAMRDLDRAFQNWFSGRSRYPTVRKRGYSDSFRFPSPGEIKMRRTGTSSGLIRLPKIGWVKLRGWRDLPGDLRNVTISRRGGEWFAAAACRRELVTPAASPLPPIGIDVGIASFASFSDGRAIEPANFGKKAMRALRQAQKAMASKRKGSANRRKAIARIARIHRRVTNARKDFLHKQTTAIAKSHGMVAVEALRVRNMVGSARGTISSPGRNVRQKAALNRSILDQGWYLFRTMLRYKLAERGGILVEVPAEFTSQTCSACGSVDAANRKTQAAFECVNCGHTANADTNAAINILRRAGSALKPVEGNRSRRPGEAGTIRRAA